MPEISPKSRSRKAAGSGNGKKNKGKKGWKIALIAVEVVVLAAAILVYAGVSRAADLWERVKSHTEDDPFNDDPFYQPDTQRQADIGSTAPGGTSESKGSSVPGETVASGEETQQAASEEEPRPLLPTIIVSDETGGTEVISLDVTKPTANEIESHVQQQMRGYMTFVVFGVDSRNNSTLLRLTQGDVCMIVSLNRDTGEVRIASVYRDTWLEGTTDYARKLTDVYCNLGATRTMVALNCNYDLEITDYVVVNWKVVAEVVNMLGGLDIELTERECNALNGEVAGIIIATGIESTTIPDVAGVHHLDGVQTVAYARIRKVGNADYQRTERQRLVVGKMLERVKQCSISEILRMIDVAVDDLATTFELIEVLDLARDVFNYSITGTTGFPIRFYTNRYIYPKDLIYNVSELHRFLYGTEDYTPSQGVQRLHGMLSELTAGH